MTKFLSNSRNPYAEKTRDEKKENVKAKFVTKSKAGTIHMFRNNTANTTGRKVTFKHV